MEDCLAPGVPKVEKANGAKGPLIPRKGRLCGLWRKNELETPGDKEVSPNSLCPAWELLSSPEARGSLGRGWRGGRVRRHSTWAVPTRREGILLHLVQVAQKGRTGGGGGSWETGKEAVGTVWTRDIHKEKGRREPDDRLVST